MSAENPHTSYSRCHICQGPTSKVLRSWRGDHIASGRTSLSSSRTASGRPTAIASRSAESWLTLVPRSAAISKPGVDGCVSANLDLLTRTFVRLGHALDLHAERPMYLVPTRVHPSLLSHGYRSGGDRCSGSGGGHHGGLRGPAPDPGVVAAEARSTFIEEYANEAAGMVLSEMDAIGDRMSDWAPDHTSATRMKPR